MGAALLGCGSSITPVPIAPAPPAPVGGTFLGSSFRGVVLAGNVPVVGATVQLYAAGMSGNGVAAGSLLASPVSTNSAGSFSVPSYSCSLPTTQLYLIATSNAGLALLTALGSCNQITASSQFTVNEVTTVAAAWALAQFAGPSFGIGATATNATGLASAFQVAAGIASPVTGTSPGTTLPANAALPPGKVNALANLLNSCSGSASRCGELFAATASSASITPANTLDAALAVVQNPGRSVAALYSLSRSSTAFAPSLTAAPTDWTLFLSITGGGMNGPATIGVLSSGNVWVSNYFGSASSFTPLGVPVFPLGITGSGLAHSYGLAVDAADDAWIGNEDDSSVTELASSGMALSSAGGFRGSGIDFPLAVAIDPDDSVWVVDYGNAHISRLSSAGSPLSGSSGYASNQIAFPVAIAIDAEHNAWIANSEGTNITRLSQDGTKVASVACCDGPDGIAIDQRGNVWVSNFYGNSVSEVSSSLVVVSSGYAAGALARPQGIAVDGAGNVWVASYRAPGVIELAGSQTAAPGAMLSPAGGWAHDAAMLEAYSVAIDASGNLWVANFGNASLTEIIGLAAPVKTPALGPAHAP